MTFPDPDSTTRPDVAPEPFPKSRLMPGDTVGRFRIEQLAGRGGMGEVFQAWDTLLERWVALKSIPTDVAADENALASIRHEAMALAQLNHPRILQVHDIVTHSDRVYLAMEWVQGQTLDHIPAPLSLQQCLQVWLEAAEGLAAAHEKGLVHRDLKPSNLMLDADGRLKILDFGLARSSGSLGELPTPSEQHLSQALPSRPLADALGGDMETGVYSGPLPVGHSTRKDTLTVEGAFVGSPHYASPEQIRSEALNSPTDIWSLGITIWEAIFGESPFPGNGLAHMQAVLENHRRPAPLRPLSRKLRVLLEQMLKPDPALRPTAATLVKVLHLHLHPKRTGRWVAALLATAVGVGGFGYVFFGRGVAADLIKDHPARIAIFPVVNATGNEELKAYTHWVLPEQIVRSLSRAERLAGIAEEDLLRATQRLRLDWTKGLSDNQMRQVATAVGADLHVVGRLQKGEADSVLFYFELRDGAGKLRTRGQIPIRANSLHGKALLPQETARVLVKAVDPLGNRDLGTLEILDPASLDQYSQASELFLKGDFKAAEPMIRPVAYRYPEFGPAVLMYGRCVAKLGAQPAEPLFQWARMSAQVAGNRMDEMRAITAYAQRLAERGDRESALEAHGQA
ncbi:MAG: serine/threonine-protein kinase, partial [Holophaga sp.]|nr:serine/threonine-protein kinase [Holophaga sp.]